MVASSCILVALGGWVLYVDQKVPENRPQMSRERPLETPVFGSSDEPQPGFFVSTVVHGLLNFIITFSNN